MLTFSKLELHPMSARVTPYFLGFFARSIICRNDDSLLLINNLIWLTARSILLTHFLCLSSKNIAAYNFAILDIL